MYTGELVVWRSPGASMSSLAAQRKTAGHLGFQKLPWVVVLGSGTSAVRMWLEAGVHAPDTRPKPHVRAPLPPSLSQGFLS